MPEPADLDPGRGRQRGRALLRGPRAAARPGFAVREAATGLGRRSGSPRRRARAGHPRHPPAGHQRLRGVPPAQGQSGDARHAGAAHLGQLHHARMPRPKGLDGGADGYLTHPVDPNELVATVRALLRARQAEIQVRAAAREWTTTFDLISDAGVPHRRRRPDRPLQRGVRPAARPAVRRAHRRAGCRSWCRSWRTTGRGGPAARPRSAWATALPGERRSRRRTATGPRRGPGCWGTSPSGSSRRRRCAGARTRRRRGCGEIEAVYSSAPVGLCVLDADLRYVRAQRARWPR